VAAPATDHILQIVGAAGAGAAGGTAKMLKAHGMIAMALMVCAVLPACKAMDSASPADVTLTLGGEMTYMADAASFTECMTGRRYPIAFEGDFVKLERAYLAAASEPGARLYVTFDGSIVDRPRMEGAGTERTVVVSRYINVWPDQRCERAMAHASLSNTYWRVVRLGDAPVAATEGRREPHLVLREADGRSSYSATAGCNQLAGSYSVDGHGIHFSPAATTLLPCPPPLDALERTLGLTLAKAARWSITASTLELFDAAGQPIALFEAVYLR
jgi:copper homeostasis protein (lipoprotein)